VRILAVGSPHGDDQAAWHVAERLRRKPLPGVEAVAVSDPVRILDYLGGCERLVLLDACRSGAKPGTVLRLVWPDPRLHERAGSSTHGFGVVKVLELADRLGWLPPSVVLIGIEAEACYPTTEASPAVRRALPNLYRQVLTEVRCRAPGVPVRRTPSFMKSPDERQASQ
jgi:hydrogenase maturation protease